MKTIRIQIKRCEWSEDNNFVLEIGDIVGRTSMSNVSKKELMEEISLEVDKLYPDLKEPKKCVHQYTRDGICKLCKKKLTPEEISDHHKDIIFKEIQKNKKEQPLEEVFLLEFESGKWSFYDNDKPDGGGLLDEFPIMVIK